MIMFFDMLPDPLFMYCVDEMLALISNNGRTQVTAFVVPLVKERSAVKCTLELLGLAGVHLSYKYPFKEEPGM